MRTDMYVLIRTYVHTYVFTYIQTMNGKKKR